MRLPSQTRHSVDSIVFLVHLNRKFSTTNALLRVDGVGWSVVRVVRWDRHYKGRWNLWAC